VRWVLPNGIARGFVHLISAPPKSGKTWFALTLARAVCAGTDWAGVSGVEQGSVLWVDEEMGAVLLTRRLRKLEFTEDLPFHTLTMNGFRLDDPRDVEAVVREAKTHSATLIVIDSFRRVHRKQENDNSEMKLLMTPLKELAATGAAVVVLHHDRKRTNFDTSEQEMSSGALDVIAQVDMVFGMKRDRDTFTMTCRSARLVGEGQAPVVSFRLEDVNDDVVAVVPVKQGDVKAEKQTLLEQAVVHFVTDNPGQSKRAVMDAIGGNHGDSAGALARLIERKTLRTVKGAKNANLYYVMDSDEAEYEDLDL
jgi:KaiC/GvpD/RAD55 family RecA-like ATPase